MNKLRFILIISIIFVSISCSKKREMFIDIDYSSRALEQMIIAGNYGFIDPDIKKAEKFFLESVELFKGNSKIYIKIFSFKDGISSRDIIIRMDKEGYRPAILSELLAFGLVKQKFFNVKKFAEIIALGSVHCSTDDHVCNLVPGICYTGTRWTIKECYFNMRILSLSIYDRGNIGWNHHYYFLGVRKENKSIGYSDQK